MLWACVVAVCASVGLTGVSGASSAPVSAPWHLDRLNQHVLPLDGVTTHGMFTGAGVDIYIIDTGVRATHEQLAGRVVAGIDIPTRNGDAPVNPPSSDCDGHGTHVAGLAAGSTVGVAPQARIISVRVLDCIWWTLSWMSAEVEGAQTSCIPARVPASKPQSLRPFAF